MNHRLQFNALTAFSYYIIRINIHQTPKKLKCDNLETTVGSTQYLGKTGEDISYEYTFLHPVKIK